MIFPFTAIVGQEKMKEGLIVNVIDPSINGLLIMGERGTAKSTAVRALADLLPERPAVKDCPFNCDPEGDLCPVCAERKAAGEKLPMVMTKMRVVELPLGITEDRLVGTLDIELAIKRGERHFSPGILAEANRNFLYVDEVNLLEDYLVDLLLDAAAMGVNTVEREGISFTHPARFILVGTMNPEEGELRPQLLDRFGLVVDVHAIVDAESRVEVIKRKASFDNDPRGFLKRWEEAQSSLRERISRARALLTRVKFTDEILYKIVSVSTELGIYGHRGDIAALKAARALAALDGRESIELRDVEEAIRLAFPHRLRKMPFDEMDKEGKTLESLLNR
ncbi:MAG TPA: ATP-binding protein [Syntrophales bacterium]|nr:ATP-binding protein [Syntrophales bacterium]HOL59521.1 ATP-binding protein [Syntrophales bacterium]HPO35611.1 ATP-binding protein [Syntrophales bacterium]